MINPVFAQNFVRKINHQMDLKINVMNEKGMIIASATPERIGDFHMCAYEIIQQGLNLLVTEKPTSDLIGVNAPGVNMRLVNNSETIGVIGVTGEPDQILNLAKMVKLTFETMYEYEYKRKIQVNARDTLSRLAYALLLETPGNLQHIAKDAKNLGFKDNYPRIPIYISALTGQPLFSFMEWYGSCSLFHSQDILLPLESGVLLCKSWKHHEAPDTKEYALACIEELTKRFFSAISEQDSPEIRFFAAPVQTSFADYHSLYSCLQYLVSRTDNDSKTVHYLTDYLLSLMVHENRDRIIPLLSYYCSLVEKQLEPEIFMETLSGLIDADMKAEAAAASLHLHKNSVFGRIKKIRDVLHLNPLSSTRDAITLMAIYEMMRERSIRHTTYS